MEKLNIANNVLKASLPPPKKRAQQKAPKRTVGEKMATKAQQKAPKNIDDNPF